MSAPFSRLKSCCTFLISHYLEHGNYEVAEIYDSDISFKLVCDTRAALHSRAPLESSGEGYVTSMGHPSVARCCISTLY